MSHNSLKSLLWGPRKIPHYHLPSLQAKETGRNLASCPSCKFSRGSQMAEGVSIRGCTRPLLCDGGLWCGKTDGTGL